RRRLAVHRDRPRRRAPRRATRARQRREIHPRARAFPRRRGQPSDDQERRAEARAPREEARTRRTRAGDPRARAAVGGVQRAAAEAQASSAASGGPAAVAICSTLTLSASIFAADFVIRSTRSSYFGGSPLMKRSGLMRETTNAFKYGLVKPRSFNRATA